MAQHKRFGASSEKTHPDQLELNLFNEAEMCATSPGQDPPMEKVTYERRKSTGKHEEDLSKLPVETVTMNEHNFTGYEIIKEKLLIGVLQRFGEFRHVR